jgi:hypothetical protein
MGIGDAMGIPLPLIAGMVVSGACFGDKMSPVSDSVVLASMSANNQRLSAAQKTQAEAKKANAADKPCWTEPPGEGGMLGGWEA